MLRRFCLCFLWRVGKDCQDVLVSHGSSTTNSLTEAVNMTQDRWLWKLLATFGTTQSSGASQQCEEDDGGGDDDDWWWWWWWWWWTINESHLLSCCLSWNACFVTFVAQLQVKLSTANTKSLASSSQSHNQAAVLQEKERLLKAHIEQLNHGISDTSTSTLLYQCHHRWLA